MGISIREYARRRGVSDTAVHKAIKQGRIAKEVDGTIEPMLADKAWLNNTARPQLNVLPDSETTRFNSALPNSGKISTGGNTYIKAKATNEVIKAQTNKLRFQQLSGELINKEEACRQVFQLSRQERDAWQAWPARISHEMAATLSVDPHALQMTLEQYVHDHLLELSKMTLKLK